MKEGDVVYLIVQRSTGIIKWKINDAKVDEIYVEELKGFEKELFPFVEMEVKGNCV